MNVVHFGFYFHFHCNKHEHLDFIIDVNDMRAPPIILVNCLGSV